MTLVQLNNTKDFEKFIKNEGIIAVHFGASWAESCSSVDEILAEYLKEMKGSFKAARIEAEEVADVSLKYAITAAPTVVIFKNGVDVGKVNGFNPVELREAITKQSFAGGASKEAEPAVKEDLNDRLKRLINKARLTLFMKGNPEQPRCGFSRQTIELLKNANADFWSFDILSDEEVRQGLKAYSNWPTYPQLYLDGELLGGLDVIREELQDPEFVARLPKLSTAGGQSNGGEPAAKEDLNDRLKRLINKARLTLFMKGNPEQPRCGFSRQTIELLKNVNADFSSFDILSDEEVRQGLKAYSNWPTYPQLYLDGELLGGLDVIREELQDPEFVARLPKLS
ncbi:hypothetical protein QR680_005256 [Steinernema hermaphroditum]|uniref:Glutaredoxin domain-containing protein n=1 Tax=Steinernema hermaphroditum TaxID=289476 RepID=A0AA39HTJ2_9BILA|nr:hypothetical protein QR680_005256 [Steinernema hermaphroditum]